MASRRTYTEDEVLNMLDDDDLDLGDEICFEGSDDEFSAGGGRELRNRQLL